MKVLHVLPTLDFRSGGPIRGVASIALECRESGIDSHIMGIGPIRNPDLEIPPSCVHSMSPSWPESYAYSREMGRWLRANVSAFDGVIIHGLWLYPGMATARECKRQNVPYACFPHGMLDLWCMQGQGWAKRLKKRLYWLGVEKDIILRSRCVLFTTPREAKNSHTASGCPLGDCRVVPYSVTYRSEVICTPDNPTLLQPQDRKVALYLGRLHPKKNIPLLIAAWKEAELSADWHLVIAGSGPDRHEAQLRRMVARADLQEHVHFVGHVSGRDKAYLFQRAKWFLLPSSQENFAIAALEAAFYFCAPAVSDQVYLSDYFPNTSEVLPLDRQAWAQFMKHRMTNETWQCTVAQAVNAALTHRCSIQQMRLGWVRLLREIFGDNG